MKPLPPPRDAITPSSDSTLLAEFEASGTSKGATLCLTALVAGLFLLSCGGFIIRVNHNFFESHPSSRHEHGSRAALIGLFTSGAGTALAATGLGLLAFSAKSAVDSAANAHAPPKKKRKAPRK